MKKIVNLTCENREGKEYYVLENNRKEIVVEKAQKKIPGKELYEMFYLDYSKDNAFTIEINDSTLTDEDRKVFGNYVKNLFLKIDEALKKQFQVNSEQTA